MPLVPQWRAILNDSHTHQKGRKMFDWLFETHMTFNYAIV
jgi:hypothetical protein